MMECDVVRDLLPLYADDACSRKSRDLVEEHLRDCPDCSDMLCKLRETELESSLLREKDTVLQYALRRFRIRSAAVGSAVSGAFLIPILVFLVINFTAGPSLDWISIVMASLCVVASLVVVPLFVPEDKFFWTFCTFCASLMLLLGVICLYTRGSWFWIASSASLFGLCAVGLPFLIRSNPLKKLIGSENRVLIVVGTDIALFINMMNMIRSHGRLTLNSLFFTLGIIAGIGLVVIALMRIRGTNK